MKLLSVFLISASCAWAVPDDPGKTALLFIEKVRDKKLNLEPGTDTALSPQTTEQKRGEISRRLERMAGDLDHSTLEIGAVKTDGEVAAVLIRKFHGFDSQKLGVFPVALVKRGVDWLAAPVPASFENSGVGYNASLRQRLAQLENWMLHEQAADLEQLRAQTGQRMRRKIEEKISADTLRTLDSQQVAGRFISACEQRNLPEILGLLGGLEADSPEDWSARLNSAELAFDAATKVIDRPWRLLASPEVLRVSLFHDEDGDTAYHVLACLDPKGFPNPSALPRVELVRLNLTKSKTGLWRVDPPSAFIQGDKEVDFSGDESSDSRLLGLLPAKLALKYPLEPESTAEKAGEALHAALANPNPAAWVRLVQFKGDTDEVCANYGKTSALWWRANDPSAAKAIFPLDFHEQDGLAVSACQFFDSRHPDQFDLQFLYFEKTAMGWLWNPIPARSSVAPLEEWIGGQPAKWEQSWQERMMAENPKIDQINGPAPDAAEARKIVLSWCEACQREDLKSALRLSTRLGTPDSPTNTLRNLGYEFAGSKLLKQIPKILSVKQGTKITAVGVKSVSDGKAFHPFYAVVATPSGPRILLEVDLAASPSRTREYLNEVSLKRLRKADPEAADELQKLYAEFRSEVGTTATE